MGKDSTYGTLEAATANATEASARKSSESARTTSFMTFIAADVVIHDDEEDDAEEDAVHKKSLPFGALTPSAVLTNKRMATMNLTKNVVGSGICSLPSALSQASIVTGLFLMTFVAFLSTASFVMIGYLCNRLGCRTYRDLWALTFGSSSSWIVDISILVNSVIGCVACVVLISDFSEKGIPGVMHTESAPSRPVLVAVSTICFLLPLSHVTDLSPLKYTSMLGVLITIYVVVLVVAAFFAEAAVSWPLRLQDNTISFDTGMLFATCIFASSFKAHYNAPVYYKELGDNVASHATVTVSAYIIAWVIYVFFAISGYGLFGNSVLGNVLKNFPEGQPSVLWAWLGMAFVIVFTYPLVFNSGRQSLYGLIPSLARARETNFTLVHICVTSGLVLVISLIGTLMNDVSIVVGFMGATVGSALSWTIPAAIYMKQLHMKQAQNSDDSHEEARRLVPWSLAGFLLSATMFAFGLLCTFGGTAVVIMKAMKQ